MLTATAILFSPGGHAPPAVLRRWLDGLQLGARNVSSGDDLMAIALRGRPRVVFIDARTHPVAALKACERLKLDSYTGVVPCVLWCRNDDASFASAFDAGADEV